MCKTILSLILLFLPNAAMSGATEANACAGALSDEARLIFEAAAPLITKDSDMRAVVRRATVALVKAGGVARPSAPDSAKAAGLCLKELI